MERIAVDVLGPLPITEAGNKYLLVIMDYFSKWPEVHPMPNQEASTVAEILVKEVVSQFGVPVTIHSDQGRNFESSLIAEMCLLLGAEKTRTTPLHPESDGMVERFNRTLEAQLSMFVDKNHRNWDTLVPLMMMAYRSAVHDTTGYTPARLLFGREIRLPIDLAFGRPQEEAPSLSYTSGYVQNLQESLEEIHRYARQHIEIKSDRMKLYYDNQYPDGATLRESMAVWLYNPQRKKGLSPKLGHSWQGPYVITKKINDLVYRIRLGPHTKPKVVHRNRLWRYNGKNVPNWYKVPADVQKSRTTDATTTSPAMTPTASVSSPQSSSQLQKSRTTDATTTSPAMTPTASVSSSQSSSPTAVHASDMSTTKSPVNDPNKGLRRGTRNRKPVNRYGQS